MSNPENIHPTSPKPSVVPSTAKPHSSNLRRTVHVLQAAVPFLQRLLPLLDGNIAATVANVLTGQPARPAPPVDLAPVEESVTKLRAQSTELHDQLAEQNLALKRLEERLEVVRESADRSTIEQQQIIGSLKKTGQKLRIFAFAALALLILSMLLDLALYLQMERALR